MVLKTGSSTFSPGNDDSCKYKYKGWYPKFVMRGKTFDSSSGATFSPSEVIKGWTEVMKIMHIGDTYEIFLPSQLGYSDGRVRIFTMTMLSCPGHK
jgi:FKBP-type peptidyl-prolyl cis-trans isomerase